MSVRSAGAVAVVWAVLLCGAEALAGPLDLAPHRALYSMGLANARPGGGMVGASGQWSYEFADSCDGWTVDNHIDITYSYAEGGQVASSTQFLSWESKDGLKYHFRMRQTHNGEISDEIEGEASLKGKGQEGTARFTRPEPRTVALPKGTLFPTEHTLRLLEAAEAGEKVFWRVVFDGFGDEGPLEVNALIGRKDSSSLKPVSAAPSLDAAAWRVRMAFYPLGVRDSLPDFELSLRYRSNGVAEDILQKFKDFGLSGRLDAIEPLPKPRC